MRRPTGPMASAPCWCPRWAHGSPVTASRRRANLGRASARADRSAPARSPSRRAGPRLDSRLRMKVAGQVVVVTGGAGGIGRALARRFHRDGAKAVVVADIDLSGAETVATEIGGLARRCDVGKEPDMVALIEETERLCGPIG